MLYHAGDSQHTQNIQISKDIGENKKCIFYFKKKTKQTFWPTQYLQDSPCYWHILHVAGDIGDMPYLQS